MLQKFKPHKYQAAVLGSQARFIAAISGIQGGKTTIGGVWLCREIYENYKAGKRGDYLIAAPTVKILQQSTMPKFKDVIPADWGTWKENKQCFELVWGDRIFVRSTDDPEHLEGMTLLDAWLDEAGQMKHDVWTFIQGRLSINKGRCLMTTTPYLLNWLFKEVYRKAYRVNDRIDENGDKNIHIVAWQSADNPAFPHDEYERAKLTMTEAQFKRRYQGMFAQVEGLVYPDFGDSMVVQPFSIPPGWKRFAGVDFGHTNPTAGLTITEDPKSKIFYVYRELYKSEVLLSDVATFFQPEMCKYILADPQSAQLINELKRSYQLGQLQPADNNIDVGIQRVVTLMKAGRLKIFKSCRNLIEEIETYHYPKPDPEGFVKDKPVAKHNHACDALRYAFSKYIDSHKLYNPNALDTSRKKRYRPLVTRRNLSYDSYTGY